MSKEVKHAEEKLADIFSYLKKRGFTPEEIVGMTNNLLKINAQDAVKVPISIFKNNQLGSLETIIKYLRENLLLSFKQIAELSNRNNATLAVTYRNAKKKLKAKFVEEESPYHIPISILKNRKLSVLENIVSYLKVNFGLTYHSIALLINRDDRTVWTVYQRALKKKKAKK